MISQIKLNEKNTNPENIKNKIEFVMSKQAYVDLSNGRRANNHKIIKLHIKFLKEQLFKLEFSTFG